MRSRVPLLASLALVLALFGTQTVLVLSASPMVPVRVDPLAPDAAATPIDAHHALARQHAPWILQEMDETLGRQDIPVAMDFDGDRDARNDWESLPHFELLPTLYYTVAETTTHIFLTYHLYYPRDWSRLDLGLHNTHEGDGGNIQIVVDKRTQEPMLLVTQTQQKAWGYAPTRGRAASGEETLRSDFEMTLGHPVVYIRSGGHEIYGSHDPRAGNRLAHAAAPVIAFRPAEEGETIVEPEPPWNETARYRLVSLAAFLQNNTAHPTLFADDEDRAPRYHAGDRYSGPFGSDRGNSPFVLGFGSNDRSFDELFWTPAERYAQAYEIHGNWSTEYLMRPFG